MSKRRKVLEEGWRRLKSRVEKFVKKQVPGPSIAVLYMKEGREGGIKFCGSSNMEKFVNEEAVQESFISCCGKEAKDGEETEESGCTERISIEMDPSAISVQNLRKIVSAIVRQHVEKVDKKVQRGYWGEDRFRPPWWPEDVPFVSPNAARGNKGRSTLTGLVETIRCYQGWMSIEAECREDPRDGNADATETGQSKKRKKTEETGEHLQKNKGKEAQKSAEVKETGQSKKRKKTEETGKHLQKNKGKEAQKSAEVKETGQSKKRKKTEETGEHLQKNKGKEAQKSAEVKETGQSKKRKKTEETGEHLQKNKGKEAQKPAEVKETGQSKKRKKTEVSGVPFKKDEELKKPDVTVSDKPRHEKNEAKNINRASLTVDDIINMCQKLNQEIWNVWMKCMWYWYRRCDPCNAEILI
ncbi:nucleolar protein 58-like [Argopecten irradians]|uniref:nucleolar protein 58-like n=1 Tax=Argopecten irradians TaxID=31199 RepID=UPI003715EF2D